MVSENKALVTRWFDEVWNKGRAEAIDEMMAPECVVYGLSGDVMRGPEQFKAFHAAYREAFPDVQITLDEIVGEGELVAARWSGAGTHHGNGLGFMATHRRATFSGMTFARLQNGKLVAGWNVFDQLGMLHQLGAIALPE